ncbi:MAG: Fic family protein [Nocardioides sp.]|uniref:Fic family protein n=1 Tax=Nocardioides sp. TaxID=35761 RepID=UPI003EFC54F0
MQPELALTTEQHVWSPRRAPIAGDRGSARFQGAPYDAAVPARIAPMAFDLDPDVTAAADDARAAITRFDSELSTLLGGEREFAPMSTVLLRTESASSSQIENITAGARALALAELGITRFGSNAREVADNVVAMRRALDLAEDVTPATILAVHEALMRHQPHIGPGELRTEQVWIGGGDLSPHGAAFVPPHQSRVATAIDDLCAFARRTDLPLLVQAAVAHAQFETIHPFNDGNGRTGRALVHAMLHRGGATTRTTVPVSAGLLANTQSYFDALDAYRAGDANPIVRRFNEASFAAIGNGRELAADIKAIEHSWLERIEARRDAVVWRVVPLLLSQPAVTSKLVQERCEISQPAADRALRTLLDAGVVQTKDEHGQDRRRDRVWRADEVLAALDRFADRTRRRT